MGFFFFGGFKCLDIQISNVMCISTFEDRNIALSQNVGKRFDLRKEVME